MGLNIQHFRLPCSSGSGRSVAPLRLSGSVEYLSEISGLDILQGLAAADSTGTLSALGARQGHSRKPTSPAGPPGVGSASAREACKWNLAMPEMLHPEVQLRRFGKPLGSP